MFFLLRTAFWLMIVFALLPALPKSGSEAAVGNAKISDSAVGPFEALTAATAAVSDAGGFCSRQPQACAIGSEVIEAMTERAEIGARLALAYVGEQIAGEKRKLAERAHAIPATSTLTIEDLAPAWRGMPGGETAPASAQPVAPAATVPLPPKRPA